MCIIHHNQYNFYPNFHTNTYDPAACGSLLCYNEYANVSRIRSTGMNFWSATRFKQKKKDFHFYHFLSLMPVSRVCVGSVSRSLTARCSLRNLYIEREKCICIRMEFFTVPFSLADFVKYNPCCLASVCQVYSCSYSIETYLFLSGHACMLEHRITSHPAIAIAIATLIFIVDGMQHRSK